MGPNQNNQLKPIGTVYGNWGGNGNINDRYDSDNSNISDNDKDNISHKDNNSNIKSNIKWITMPIVILTTTVIL